MVTPVHVEVTDSYIIGDKSGDNRFYDRLIPRAE